MEEIELEHEVAIIDGQIGALVIQDQETYEIAGESVVAIDSLIKKVKEYWEEPIKKAHEVHKALTKKRAEMFNPLQEKRSQLNRKISVYLTEQERARKEEQRKLDEKRKREEDAERKKLEARAANAEEKGKDEKAAALREKAEDVYVPPVVAKPVEKTTRTEGATITAKKDVEIEILDEKAVLKHVISGTLPISVVSISLPKLKQAIKMHQIERLEGLSIQEVSKAQFRKRNA